MADDFNPYQQWLGMPATAGSPDHYALLGLEPHDVDQEQVRRAAVQRKARVRGIRPGQQVAAWSRLLDELDAAQRCLSDPTRKSEYDAQLLAHHPEPPAVALEAAPVHNLMPPVWPETRLAAATDSPSLASDRGSGLLNGPPEMTELTDEFVVPREVPVGAAAQLLPPFASMTPASQGAALLSPVLLQSGVTPPMTVPWPSLSSPSTPEVGAASAKPVFATPATSVPKPTSPWTSAAVISIAGIGLAIVMLAGAIALVWRARNVDAAKARGDNGTTTAEASNPAISPESQPVPTPPTPEPHPTREPAQIPDTTPKPTPAPEPVPAPNPSPVPMPNPEPPMGPMPPPTPLEPTPAPKPQPAPTPPVAPTPEEIRQVQAVLRKARQMLADRDTAGATAAVKEAQQLAGEGPLRDKIAPTEALSQCVSEFWSAVGAALPKLTGSEIEVGDTRVFVIASGPDRLLIRWAGKNREFTRKTLPAGLARRIAEDWLDQSPTSKVIVGAFLVVDPTLSANSGREKARKLWTEAAAGGADVAELLKVLSEPEM